MPHPFFDAESFPWHRRDAQDLHRGLMRTIARYEAIEHAYLQCGQDLPPLPVPTGLSPEVLWFTALQQLHDAQALPALCEQILANDGWKVLHGAARAIVDATDQPAAAGRAVKPPVVMWLRWGIVGAGSAMAAALALLRSSWLVVHAVVPVALALVLTAALTTVFRRDEPTTPRQQTAYHVAANVAAGLLAYGVLALVRDLVGFDSRALAGIAFGIVMGTWAVMSLFIVARRDLRWRSGARTWLAIAQQIAVAPVALLCFVTFQTLGPARADRSFPCLGCDATARGPGTLKVSVALLDDQRALAIGLQAWAEARRHPAPGTGSAPAEPELAFEIIHVGYESAALRFCGATRIADLVVLDQPWLPACTDALAPFAAARASAVAGTFHTPPREDAAGRVVALPLFLNVMGAWVRPDASTQLVDRCVVRDGDRPPAFETKHLLDPSCYPPGTKKLPVGVRWNEPSARVEAFLLLYLQGGGALGPAQGDAVVLERDAVDHALALLPRLHGPCPRSGRGATEDDLRRSIIRSELYAVIGWNDWAANDHGFWQVADALSFQPFDPTLSGHGYVGVRSGVASASLSALAIEMATGDAFQLSKLPGNGLVPARIGATTNSTSSVNAMIERVRSANAVERPRLARWNDFEGRLSEWLNRRVCDKHVDEVPPFALRDRGGQSGQPSPSATPL